MMDLNTYQEEAMKFSEFQNFEYPFFALAEEVGEFLGIVAKAYRGDDMVKRFGSVKAFEEATKKELGDILWQLSACCHALEFDLADIAELNLAKLADRNRSHVISARDSVKVVA